MAEWDQHGEVNMHHCVLCNTGHPVGESCPDRPCDADGCNEPRLRGTLKCPRHFGDETTGGE